MPQNQNPLFDLLGKLFAFIVSIGPFAFLIVGAALLVLELQALKRSPSKGANAKAEPLHVQALQFGLTLFAVATVLWAMRQPLDAPILDWIAGACVWAALASAVILVGDDLVLAPKRLLCVKAGEEPLPTPLYIEILRRVMVAFVLGSVVRAVRAHALDFSLVLVVAMAATGALWALDAFLMRKRRLALAAQHGTSAEIAALAPMSVEYAQSFFPIIVIVLIVRSFLVEPFRIPSDSMMPGLLDGDFIFVNKYAYGLRLPVLNSKIVPIGAPQRGDVIVFRLPSDPSINYIKRLVGLPGDRISVRNNRVYVNDELMPLRMDGYESFGNKYFNVPQGIETLAGVEHRVMFVPGEHTDFEATVPAGHYFFMGDNRNNSQDGRFSAVGMVPDKNLVGRAVRIWLHWQKDHGPVWDRVGNKIE